MATKIFSSNEKVCGGCSGLCLYFSFIDFKLAKQQTSQYLQYDKPNIKSGSTAVKLLQCGTADDRSFQLLGKKRDNRSTLVYR